MTHGPETLEEETKAEAPDAQGGFDLSQLWLLPLLLLAQILALFAGHADTLKALRRRVRTLPETWKDHIADLLIAEGYIRALTACGIEILLSGRELDLTDLSHARGPSGDLQIPLPRSAWEAHRRFEAIARFHADPEAFIQRQARRLAAAKRGRSKTATACDRAGGIIGMLGMLGTIGIVGMIGTIGVSARAAPHPSRRIRGPPRTGLSPQSIPSRPAGSPPGARAHA